LAGRAQDRNAGELLLDEHGNDVSEHPGMVVQILRPERHAMQALAAEPERAVPFLKERLWPALADDPALER